MVQKKKYRDIFTEIDYALVKITKKRISRGNLAVKRRFWQRLALSEMTF